MNFSDRSIYFYLQIFFQYDLNGDLLGADTQKKQIKDIKLQAIYLFHFIFFTLVYPQKTLIYNLCSDILFELYLI